MREPKSNVLAPLSTVRTSFTDRRSYDCPSVLTGGIWNFPCRWVGAELLQPINSGAHHLETMRTAHSMSRYQWVCVDPQRYQLVESLSGRAIVEIDRTDDGWRWER